MMIVDSFPFFQEFDLLELRLTILDPVVDRFIIVEGTRTYSGVSKPLRLPQNKDRYKKWWKKIDYIPVDDWPETDNAWITENHQRNALARGWAKLADDDVIISSDLDEIPNPDVIDENAGLSGVKWFMQRDFRNFFNAQNVEHPLWRGGSRMVSYGEFKRLGELRKFKYCKFGPASVNQGPTAVKLRRMRDVILIPNGGWHFSFLGGVDAIIRKIQAYSHQERNNPEFLNRERLINALKNGENIMGGRLCVSPIDELGVPNDILHLMRKFPELIAPEQSLSVRKDLERVMVRNGMIQKFSRRYVERWVRRFCALHGFYYRMSR